MNFFMSIFSMSLVFASFSSITLAQSPDSAELRRLISLVDYLHGDYHGAIGENHEVLSAEEYAEQQEFAGAALREFNKISKTLKPTEAEVISQKLTALVAAVDSKESSAVVEDLATSIKNLAIHDFGVLTSPKQKPDLKIATETYQTQCASCHGPDGRAETDQAKLLKPAPRNFHEADAMERGSPFKYFNTMNLGIEGTSMPKFEGVLDENQIWSVAFFVAGIRHNPLFNPASPAGHWLDLDSGTRATLLANGLNLSLLGRFSDEELRSWLANTARIQQDNLPRILAILRVNAPFEADFPSTAALASTGSNPGQNGPGGKLVKEFLAATIAKVDAAEAAVQSGNLSAVDTLLIDGYLDGFEHVEIALGILDRSLVKSIEQAFLEARTIARSDRQAESITALANLHQLLTTAQKLLVQAEHAKDNEDISASTSKFMSSFIIILREGFEAFLIVAALLASLQNLGASGAKRWIHVGWVSAVLAGVATFFLFSELIKVSGAQQELIEGLATGIAAIVLFYVGFWLLSQAERSKWEKYIKTSAKAAIGSGKLWTLASLAFVAVYREAAETVLFYNALMVSAGSKSGVLLGFVSGCALLLGICWGIMRFGLRLPLRKFFLVTSGFMVVISVILVGKAVAEFGKAGILQQTHIGFIPTGGILEFFGVYPSLESCLAQGITVLLAVGIIILARRISKNRLNAAKPASQTPPHDGVVAGT